MFRRKIGEARKYSSRSCPYGNSIPLPDMLTEFYLCIHCTLVAIAPFIITTHRVRTSECCHQSPRRIAIIQQSVKLPCQYPAFPYRMVIAGRQFRTAESIFIAKKSRTKPLVDPQIISCLLYTSPSPRDRG